jgi:hypothetical protein
MAKQCAICPILLDVPCAQPFCPGHHNASAGERCVYCATHERDDVLSLHGLGASVHASLEGVESLGEDG